MDIEKLLRVLKDFGINSYISLVLVFVFIGKDLGLKKDDIVNMYHLFFADNHSFAIIFNFLLMTAIFFNYKRIAKKIDASQREKYLENRRQQIMKAYENSIGKEKYEKIKQVMRDLLNHYRASRIWFFVYHNGGFTPTGIGRKRMSICFEATNVGISIIGTRFLDMDINFFSEWVGTFVKKKDVFVRRLTDEMPEQWKLITETSGYKSLYSSGMWTEEDMPYGFFGMGFQYEEVLTEEQLTYYRETQKELNKIIAQERNYINVM